jgi:hypothetical protein
MMLTASPPSWPTLTALAINDMTCSRRDGGREETPFGKWVRARKDLDSIVYWLDVCDGDYIFHQYKTHDGKHGTRQVKQIMLVEVKTFSQMPKPNQLETLWLWHQITFNRRPGETRLKGLPGRPAVNVWSHGVFVLQLESDTPERGAIRWHHFLPDGRLEEYELADQDHLAHILGFRVRPNEPNRRLSVRTHHFSEEVTVKRTLPLGFVIDETFTRRS